MLANHPNVLSGGGVATNIIGGTGLFADGTLAAPSISFASDPDTGFFHHVSDQIALAFGSLDRGYFSVTGNDFIVRSSVSDAQLTLGSAGNVALQATQTNQNITLTPSGTGYVGHSVTPANVSQGTAGGYSGVGFAINYGGYGLAFGSNYSGQGWIQQQSFTGGAYYNLTLQASGGKLLVGTAADSSNGILQLSTNALATTSAYGIGFGTDVSLYRAAANVLALDSGDALQLGNQYVNTVAVSTGTVTIRDSTGTVYRLLCVV